MEGIPEKPTDLLDENDPRHRESVERNRTEQALRESEENWRTLAANIPEFICTLDRQGTILFINHVLPGYVLEEVIGTTTFDYVEPQFHAQIRAGLERIFDHGESFEIEMIGAGSPGETRYYQSRFSPVRRGDKVVAALNIGADITDRKLAEQSLRSSQERYQRVVEGSLQGILIHQDDHIRYVNPALARMFGYVNSDALVNRHYWQTLVATEEWPELQGRTAAIYRGESLPLHSGWRGIRQDGSTIWIASTGSRIEWEGRPASVSFFLDVTERKRAEEERQRLEAQVLHSQKLESLGILAGGVAHDFNNLLTGMLGFATLARMHLPPESPACSMLSQIEKTAQRAADLAQQMLAYSGKGKFVVKVFRLDTLVHEMTNLLEPVISRKASLQLDLAPANIEGDPTQIRQVVMNLITNASDALEGKSGAIDIRTGVLQAEPADLRTDVLPQDLPAGEYAFVEVRDTGCGMSAETLKKVFDPFFTTKFTGRGLGLAAVLGIVRGHFGTIKVTTDLGKGTVMQVLLPSTPTGRTELTAKPTSTYYHSCQGAILVVDDEDPVRAYVRQVLESAGFTVHTAADGQEALAFLSQQHREIAALILDLTMPRLDGLDVLHHLASQGLKIPVLLMSGYSEQEVASRTAGLGVRGFLQKPFPPEQLLARVSELLSAHSRRR